MLRSQIKAQMALAFRMNQIQIQQIISQPTPKFPTGGCDVMGNAIVGENGEEIIINKNHEFITLHNNI